MKDKIVTEVGVDGCHFIDSTAIATKLLGDSIASNLFLLGFAWQRGLVPVSSAALETAIELNGVAIEFNKQAFLWGRRCADQPNRVMRLVLQDEKPQKVSLSLEEVITDRVKRLTDYQNADYAEQYRRRMLELYTRDCKITQEHSLTAAVADNLYKLMAYKDEYEVARLYSDGEFLRKLRNQFEGDYELRFNMAPPLFSKRDPNTGHLLKREFGPWMMKAFTVLAKLKFLRGTVLDVFGYSDERKQERDDIAQYESMLDMIIENLTLENYAVAIQLMKLPAKLRGFGHVKDRNREKLELEKQALLRKFNAEEDVSIVQFVNAA